MQSIYIYIYIYIYMMLYNYIGINKKYARHMNNRIYLTINTLFIILYARKNIFQKLI